MREIKFRAFCGNMMESDKFDSLATFFGYYREQFFFNESKEGEPTSVIFMQWAGLKDKKGADIYEGDILKKDYGSSKPYVIVAWHNERAAFINNDGYNELLFHQPTYRLEIIGNIYEHPHLLTDKVSPVNRK